MAASPQQYKIQMLPAILPKEETDVQPHQFANNETVSVGDNMDTMLREQHRPNRRCCLKSSAAILILVWNLSAAIGLEFISNPITGTVISLSYPFDSLLLSLRIILYTLFSFYLLLYPLAGYLADSRWGRHKTIVGSLRFLLLSLIMILVLGSLGMMASTPILLHYPLGRVQIVGIIAICFVFGIPILLGFLLTSCSLVAISANVFQYGIDQLMHDLHSEDVGLYICWYIWTAYLAEFIVRIPRTFLGAFFVWINLGILVILLPIMIGVGFCIKKQRMFIDAKPDVNPYKLAYKVIKFVASRKDTLLHTNDFSDNDFDLPNSRFDLGMEIYGGPFTTKQVEEVKCYLQIFCILLTLGPALMMDVAVRELLPNFEFHMDGHPLFDTIIDRYIESYIYNDLNYDLLKSLISNGIVGPLIVVVVLPLYIGLLRRRMYNYTPGALKRIGLGMLFIFLSGLCSLSMDTYGHFHTIRNATSCFLTLKLYDDYDSIYYIDTSSTILGVSSYFLIFQSVLNAIGYMLLYVSMFEFICAQSPQSMRGILICSFFAIKGCFQLLGVLVVFAPFTGWSLPNAFPSCGFVYYLINTVLVLAGIVAFTIAARKYQYQVKIDHNEIQNDEAHLQPPNVLPDNAN